MQFGVMHLFSLTDGKSEAQVFAETMEQILYAEELGFDTVWLAEHHFHPYGICPSTMVFLAAVAERAKRLRLGTAVRVLPLDHPLRVAEDGAVLDLISQGRFNLGVGSGYQKGEFSGFGVPIWERRERLRESIEIIDAAWSQERFSYDGQFYKIKDVSVRPKPWQRPRPPIYVGAWSPETIQWTAERGYNLLTGQFHPLDEVPQAFATFRQAAAASGHGDKTVDMPLLRHVYLADDAGLALREPKASMEHYYDVLFQVGDISKGRVIKAGQTQYDFMAEHVALFGDPEQIAGRVAGMQRDFDLNHLICWFEYPLLDRGRVYRAMELFAKHVMPRFRTTGVLTGN